MLTHESWIFKDTRCKYKKPLTLQADTYLTSHTRAALVSSWALITSTKFARLSPLTVCSSSPVATTHQLILPESLVQDCQQKTKCFPHINTSCQSTFYSAGELRGCCYQPLLLGRTWARPAKTQSPWIMNRLYYQDKNNSYFVMAFPIPGWWEIMQEIEQEHFKGCRVVRASRVAHTHFSGIIYSTWSLGVSQIIHINFYTGVSPADALSPKCLETICFLEWGQNSQLLLTSLSSKCPWWVIIRCTWVSREGKRRMWLDCFCLDGLSNCS